MAEISDKNKFELMGVKGIVRELDGAGVGLVDTTGCDLSFGIVDGHAGMRHSEAK